MKLNKFEKWLVEAKAEITVKLDNVIVFTIDNVRYKLESLHTRNRISFLFLYKLESQLDKSLPDIRTLIASEKTQQKLLESFKEYLNK
jgi:hypothetical protein